MKNCVRFLGILLITGVVTSCDLALEKEHRPPRGEVKRYFYHLGIMYGRIKRVVETFEKNGARDTLSVTYDYVEGERKLIEGKGKSIYQEYYYDSSLHLDSSVLYGLQEQPSTLLYHKTKYFNDYYWHYIRGTVNDNYPSTIAVDTVTNTVNVFYRGALIQRDSFNKSGLLVWHRVFLSDVVERHTYNEAGHKIASDVDFLNTPDAFSKIETLYEYDQHGNWIKRVERATSTDENLPNGSILHRDITYYE